MKVGFFVTAPMTANLFCMVSTNVHLSESCCGMYDPVCTTEKDVCMRPVDNELWEAQSQTQEPEFRQSRAFPFL